MKLEKVKIFNLEGAVRGMRNPLKSWDKSDSAYAYSQTSADIIYILGPKDKELCYKLIKGGSEHRKFLRQIFISFDLTAPDYFWKEYETYQVGVTENSTSTMHTLMKRDLTIEDFEWDKENGGIEKDIFVQLMAGINLARKFYIESKVEEERIKLWRYIIQILPMSFLYTRTCTMNYEVLINMYNQRKNHKLKEWHFFLDEMLKKIPYPEFITGDF